jgi:hypothetical protein
MHHQPNRTSTSIRQRHFLLAKHKRSSLFLEILKEKKRSIIRALQYCNLWSNHHYTTQFWSAKHKRSSLFFKIVKAQKKVLYESNVLKLFTQASHK